MVKVGSVHAFTLVELIVVISILAILGTIAFISLQNYTKDARNVKRINDGRQLLEKIQIENAKGVSMADLMTQSGILNGTGNLSGQIITLGTPNYSNLNENTLSFESLNVFAWTNGGQQFGVSIYQEGGNRICYGIGQYYTDLFLDTEYDCGRSNVSEGVNNDNSTQLPTSINGESIACTSNFGNGIETRYFSKINQHIYTNYDYETLLFEYRPSWNLENRNNGNFGWTFPIGDINTYPSFSMCASLGIGRRLPSILEMYGGVYENEEYFGTGGVVPCINSDIIDIKENVCYRTSEGYDGRGRITTIFFGDEFSSCDDYDSSEEFLCIHD